MSALAKVCRQSPERIAPAIDGALILGTPIEPI